MDDKMIQKIMTPEVVKKLFHAAEDYARIRKELDSRPANAFEAYYSGALYGYLEKSKEIIEEATTAINKDVLPKK